MLNSLEGLKLETKKKKYNAIINKLFTSMVSRVSNMQENK